MRDFALRFGREWVLFNRGSWSAAGWIAIKAVYIPSAVGEWQKLFSLGWNGERFADSKEFVRLKTFNPTAPDLLRMLLSRTVKAPDTVEAE